MVQGDQPLTGVLLSICPGKYWKLFQWKAYGGVFDDIPASFNAFPHRKGTLMHAEFGTSFGYQKPAAAINRDYAAEIYGELTAHTLQQSAAVAALLLGPAQPLVLHHFLCWTGGCALLTCGGG
jgi:hypothetical protein